MQNMETSDDKILNRISATFEDIKNTLKFKSSVDRLTTLKRDIQMLGTELVVFGKESHEHFIRSLAMEGYLALITAKTMPISIADKRNVLRVAYEKLKPYVLREECLFIFLRIQNLLCYYLIQLDQTAQACEILEKLEDLYDKISRTQPDKYLDAEDLFTTDPIQKIKKVNPEKLDKVITNNIQMQAYLYNKLNMPERYILYNHMLLRRQLEMKEGTPQEWALRTARFGNYFTYLNHLENARHHLCAAYYVLRTCHDNCKMIPSEFIVQKANFETHFLELSHHWVKYGLTLFKLSKKKILRRYFASPQTTSGPDLWKSLDMKEQSSDENIKDVGAEKNEKGDCIVEKEFCFPTLDLKEMEAKIPVEIITDYKGARKVFSFTYKWLMRAKHYYDFEHHSAQFISCSLQLAELYEHLAFFETNVDYQYSIQKRRADVLENLNSLLKNCGNVAVQIDIIRELSQVQLELMALNLQKLWREESQTNVINMDNDADSILNSDSESNKTLPEKTLSVASKNIFLRKMEAASAINGRLVRLNSHLVPYTPSQYSFASTFTKN